MDENLKKQIVSCVEKSMQTENFSKMNIDLMITNEKGEGFIADLLFAKVTETDKDNKYKEVNLALKIGKRGKGLRENLPTVIECYQRELFFYDTVLPAFRQFQLERNIANVFDAFPKCYGTVLTDDIEALVLENLKIKGYVLHDKLLTMNLQHLQLVLKNYAKLHALSFAFRDQHKDEFNKFIGNSSSVLRNMCAFWFNAETDPKVLKMLREAGRGDLAEKYLDRTQNDELACLLAVLDDAPQESAVLHGDGHNNNFLFEYEGDDEENPLRVAIIDWQISGIHSPVLDLSYFLYSTASRKELFRLDELLKFYHSHLTDFMKQLGSNAQKVFPYSTLVEHWKKYSIYGFISAKFVLYMFYIPENLTPVITGKKESDQQAWKDIKLHNEDLYIERVVSCVDHHFNFMLT